MRNVLLKFEEHELADIEAAFEKAQAAWGTLAKFIGTGADTPAKSYLGYLLLNSDKTAHKVKALIGIGMFLADLLGKRDSENATQMLVGMTARKVWPELILPAPNCRLSGLPLDEFLALVEDEEPSNE